MADFGSSPNEVNSAASGAAFAGDRPLERVERKWFVASRTADWVPLFSVDAAPDASGTHGARQQRVAVSLPAGKEALSAAPLAPETQAAYRREIPASMHPCNVKHAPAPSCWRRNIRRQRRGKAQRVRPSHRALQMSCRPRYGNTAQVRTAGPQWGDWQHDHPNAFRSISMLLGTAVEGSSLPSISRETQPV